MVASTHSEPEIKLANDPIEVKDPVRFYAMDALRASAMLLGIVFHAAWIFAPSFFWTPITELNGNWYCLFFFYTCHIFRMQIFFLMAGFFAALLISKRGAWSFLRNRMIRIALPLVVGWLILYPIMEYYQFVGGKESGRIQSDATVGALVLESIQSINVFLFQFFHLWFLYYLLMISVALLVIRGVMRINLAPIVGFKRLYYRLIFLAVASRFNVFILAIATTPILFASGWFGIDTPAFGIFPNLIILIAYGVFFAVGWVTFRHLDLLEAYVRRWPLHLVFGLALTAPLFWMFSMEFKAGYYPMAYPMLTCYQIGDYSKLRDRLIADDTASKSGRLARKVWNRIPGEYQVFIRNNDNASSDELAGIAGVLSQLVIFSVDAFDRADYESLRSAGKIAPNSLGEAEPALFERLVWNRMLLDEACPESFILPPAATTESTIRKWIYSVLYSLSMWLLVFGFIGMFLRHFDNPSRSWRYISDSSYWMYLAHLVFLFQFQIWFARVWIPWPIKIGLYLAFTFVGLLITYHFLVRSTPIGLILNGRMAPFRWPALPGTGNTSSQETV